MATMDSKSEGGDEKPHRSRTRQRIVEWFSLANPDLYIVIGIIIIVLVLVSFPLPLLCLNHESGFRMSKWSVATTWP